MATMIHIIGDLLRTTSSTAGFEIPFSLSQNCSAIEKGAPGDSPVGVVAERVRSDLTVVNDRRVSQFFTALFRWRQERGFAGECICKVRRTWASSYSRDADNMATSPINSKAALVHRFPLFSGISLPDCASIVSRAREKHLSRRQTIFVQGDPVREILLLLSGCVKLTQFGQEGSEVILRLAGPGQIVGALGLFTEGGYRSTAQTMESSVALVWETAYFGSLLERFPMLRHNLIIVLAERLQEMDERFREVSTEKVGSRLSSQLVRLSNQVGKRVNGHVEIGLSRAELAQLIGTTLFTVSRLLCQWETRGIVFSERECVLLRDLPALEIMSQGEAEAS